MNQHDRRTDDGDGDDGDDNQEESSSSSLEKVEDALATFREQWQRELEISPKKEVSVNNKYKKTLNDYPAVVVGIEELSTETKAKNLFLKGIEYEKNGEMYDAIRFYKRAVQLVPDIELRLYESTKRNVRNEKFDVDDKSQLDSHVDDKDDYDHNLLFKLSKVFDCNHLICNPCYEQTTTHISALPMEIILYILRWVVSSDLDIRSLEMFSRVCRGFFIAARDPEIWRLACVRVWGVNCGHYEPKYQNWRQMYLERRRLRFNGCYISKTTYIRHGENSFQDQFYRPWQLVEYLRYLRFFPEGRVLMLTSTDDAQNCVNTLKNRNPRNVSVLIGHYRLHEDGVILMLKKQTSANVNSYKKKRRDVVHDSGDQTYHMELEIQNHHRKTNYQLNWIRYNIFTKYKNGQESLNVLNVLGKYTSFKFSRVKSFTQESELVLQ